MIIKSVSVKKFRDLKDLNIKIGRNLTCICGRNATMKTTLLGIIAHPFSCSKKRNSSTPFDNTSIIYKKTLSGYSFESKLGDRFKISKEYDKIGEHEWEIILEQNFHENNKISMSSQNRIDKKGQDPKIRFWNIKGKNKGQGFVKAPVIYLSLGRAFPIGESSNKKNVNIILSDEEKNLYIKGYKYILGINNINHKEEIGIKLYNQSKNILFAGIESSKYDLETNSSGESVIGIILLSILSFIRLKNECKDYKGGLLLIDEIETTFHSASKRNLIKYLNDVSKEYRIQIIFTTHSPIILEEVNQLQRNSIIKDTNEYNNDYQIINLIRRGDKIIYNMINNSNDMHKMINDLDLRPNIVNYNISIYTEDDEAKEAMEYILKHFIKFDICNKLNFKSVSLGYPNYMQLLDKGVEEFKNSIIILDNDVQVEINKNKTHKKIFNENNNCLILPLTVEKDMFKFFRETEKCEKLCEIFIDKNPNSSMEYDYIFKDCYEDYSDSKEVDAKYFKNWFRRATNEYTIDKSIFYDIWLEDDTNCENSKKFVEQFIEAYNELADKLKLDRIYINIE